MGNRNIISVIKSITNVGWISIVITFFIGCILFLAGFIFQRENQELGHFMIVFATIITLEAIASIINRSALETKYITNVSSEVARQFEYFKLETSAENTKLFDELKKGVADVVALKMAGIQKIREIGVVNVFDNFDIKRVIQKIKTVKNRTLILQRIYFSDEEFSTLYNDGHLLELIVKYKCNIQILLLAPKEEGTIQKRLETLLTGVEQIIVEGILIQEKISQQLILLNGLKEKMPPELHHKLQIKFHYQPVVASLTSFDDRIIQCPYLSRRVADSGIHTEIRGYHTKSYHEWMKHFRTGWNMGTIFGDKGPFLNDMSDQNCKIRRRGTLDDFLPSENNID